MKRYLGLALALLLASCSSTKTPQQTTSTKSDMPHYWQQSVDYTMEVDMDVDRYQYTGKQKLVYTNNSPETIDKVYYHLFFNAFQPNSDMDIRSRTIEDPDKRVGSRIIALDEQEIGYLYPTRMTQDGADLEPIVEGTILVVPLSQPLLPGNSTVLDMDFKGQVPVQIRRSGRNNKEGVALSMTQWFPKLAEFDRYGWNTAPYIGREFHGVWGNFDVKLTLDKAYTVGGTGYLQNPNEIGHGYDKPNSDPKKGKDGKLTWHFKAPMVHDFAWGADPDFIHDIYSGENGVQLHFLYKDNSAIQENWKKLQPLTNKMLQYFNEHIGPYPYKQYSVIQGGDGGMEYAMCTLITGERKLGSLVGVTAHEFAHSWFNHILATNESKHEWMDEGFTTYISTLAEAWMANKNPQEAMQSSYRNYIYLAKSGKEEPQTTHADHYHTNLAYGLTAYSKGAVFMSQLGYIVGPEVRDQIIKAYYNTWKFKHPEPNDFKRVAERVSGFDLEWYLRDWTMTTKTIDYAVDEVSTVDDVVTISLKRKGQIGMPVDLAIEMTDGTVQMINIPLTEMRGQKKVAKNWQVAQDWSWAHPTYDLELPKVNMRNIKKITIDPTNEMADIDKANNSWSLEP